ncbi:MAG TPA: ferredoxin [Candidatus Dormibacteraeota bacterium]|jgi:ferredoxin|nr:ferredoxin [Candidatus Dormibacteraeota bacterium]
MRIVVDLNRCQGYGQCVFLAPGVFELQGEEALMYDPGPDRSQRVPVLRAAAACPVQAIRVEHGHSLPPTQPSPGPGEEGRGGRGRR